MENSNGPIVLLRKKNWREIMGESYRLLSGNSRLLMKLVLIGLVPAFLVPYFIVMFPQWSQYFTYWVPEHSVLADPIPHWGVLRWIVWMLVIQLYLDVVPFAFVRKYFQARESNMPLTFKDSLHSLVTIDLPKGLLLFVVLLIPAVVLFPIGLYIYVPFALISVSFMLQPVSLGKAIKEGFVLGTKYWARTVAGGIAFLFMAGVIMCIFVAPYVVLMYARASAFQSGLEGNEVFLPWYFGPVLFVVCLVMQVVAQVLNLFGMTALILHFFNLKARS